MRESGQVNDNPINTSSYHIKIFAFDNFILKARLNVYKRHKDETIIRDFKVIF